jgi:hypothetical protein
MHRCALWGCWIIAVGLGCSGKAGPQVGSETHWLAACAEASECGAEGLSCVCGTCTRACSTDATCGDPEDVACFDPNSPLLLQRCEDRGASHAAGLCLPRCTLDAECGSTRACAQGACVPTLQANALSFRDYETVDSSVPWSTAVTLPTPEVTIVGGDDRLVGTWEEQLCDPSNQYSSCHRIVIGKTPGGTFEGNVFVYRADDAREPFAPPVDPDRGYPTKVPVDEYHDLTATPPTKTPYRLLDGVFANNRLTASWSPLDLWHAWCEMQTPYRWQVIDHEMFFCVPQDAAAQATIDPGKLALCTSDTFDQPLCEDEYGHREPCVCNPEHNGPRCGSANCRCDSQHCDADLHLPEHLELTLEGDSLSGLSADGYSFNRVAP